MEIVMDSWSNVRTDLALEAREGIGEKESGLHGVEVEEHYDEESDVHITRVVIETRNGAKALGKPMGTYITLEAPAIRKYRAFWQSSFAGSCRIPTRNSRFWWWGLATGRSPRIPSDRMWWIISLSTGIL